MNLNITLKSNAIRSVIFDVMAVLLVYIIPTLSHLTGFPLYYAEPMRILVIFALVHTKRINAYVLAFTLPLFSFTIGSHPVFVKSLLMAAELGLNVFLFYFLQPYFKHLFPRILLSIVLSKLFYYLLKYGMITFLLLEGNLIATPAVFQIGVSLLLSFYVVFFYNKKAGV